MSGGREAWPVPVTETIVEGGGVGVASLFTGASVVASSQPLSYDL